MFYVSSVDDTGSGGIDDGTRDYFMCFFGRKKRKIYTQAEWKKHFSLMFFLMYRKCTFLLAAGLIF